MKSLKNTYEYRAYSEEEARAIIESYRQQAEKQHFSITNAGYTYKTKKKKGAVVAEGWLVKITTALDDFWDEGEGEEV